MKLILRVVSLTLLMFSLLIWVTSRRYKLKMTRQLRLAIKSKSYYELETPKQGLEYLNGSDDKNV